MAWDVHKEDQIEIELSQTDSLRDQPEARWETQGYLT